MKEKEIKQEIVQAQSKVDVIKIQSPEDVGIAGSIVIDLENLAKRIQNYWDEPIKKAHEAHKSLTKKRAEMLRPVEEKKNILRRKISAYLTEQDRIRREKQRKLDEERELKEQKERDKLQKAAEKAKEKGNYEKADDLIEQAENVNIIPTIIEPSVKKTTRLETGTMSSKKDLQIRIEDIKKVLSAVVSGILPVSVVQINETKLKQAIKLNGITKLDGCVIEDVVKAAFRGE